jgi:hypothetical protein
VLQALDKAVDFGSARRATSTINHTNDPIIDHRHSLFTIVF